MSFETPEQLAAGIALAKKTAREFAAEAKVTPMTLSRILNSDKALKNMRPHTRKCIEKCFALHNIEFTGENGVKKRTDKIRILHDTHGFREFMNDVYTVTKATPDSQFNEICVSNVDERNWIRWMKQEKYDEHAQKMAALPNNYSFKIFIQEKDNFFIASEFAEYKYLPNNYFTDDSFYVYGNKLALIDFGDIVTINIINNPRWAKSFRRLFNYAWDRTPGIKEKR